MKYFFIGILLTANLFANTWADLEIDQDYKLTQDLQLEQTERSSSFLELLKGEPFKLRDIMPLDMVRVVAFIFEYKNCPGPDLRTEMTIIPVASTGVEIGALVDTGCTFEIYIENKDIMTKSFFE